jgi:hypothetical protein
MGQMFLQAGLQHPGIKPWLFMKEQDNSLKFGDIKTKTSTFLKGSTVVLLRAYKYAQH